MYHAGMSKLDSGSSSLGSSGAVGRGSSRGSSGGYGGGGKGYIPAGKLRISLQQNPKTPQQAASDAAYRDGYKAGDKNIFSSEKPSGRLANDPQYRRQYAQGHRAAITERYDTNRSSLKKTMSDWALSRKNSM